MSRNKSTIWTEAAVREGSWRTGIVFIFNAEWYQSSVSAFTWCWSVFSPTWIQIIPQNPLLKLRVGDYSLSEVVDCSNETLLRLNTSQYASKWVLRKSLRCWNYNRIVFNDGDKNYYFSWPSNNTAKTSMFGLNYLLVLVILMICLHIYCDVKIRIMFWFGKAMLVCVQRDQFARGRW